MATASKAKAFAQQFAQQPDLGATEETQPAAELDKAELAYLMKQLADAKAQESEFGFSKSAWTGVKMGVKLGATIGGVVGVVVLASYAGKAVANKMFGVPVAPSA